MNKSSYFSYYNSVLYFIASYGKRYIYMKASTKPCLDCIFSRTIIWTLIVASPQGVRSHATWTRSAEQVQGQQPGSAMSPDLQANPQWWGRSNQDVSLLSQLGSGSKGSCSCNVARAETRAQILRLNAAPERWGWWPPRCLKAALVKLSWAEAADCCGRRYTHSPDGKKAAPHVS